MARRHATVYGVGAAWLVLATAALPAERHGIRLSLEGNVLLSYLSSLDELQPEGDLSLRLAGQRRGHTRPDLRLRLVHDRQRLKLYNFDPTELGPERLFTTLTGVYADLGLEQRLSGRSKLVLGAEAEYEDYQDAGDDSWSVGFSANWEMDLQRRIQLVTGYAISLTRFPDYFRSARKLDSWRQMLSSQLEYRFSSKLRMRVSGRISPKSYLESKFYELSGQGENRNVVRATEDRLYLSEEGEVELELRPSMDARVQIGYGYGVNDSFHDNRIVLGRLFVQDYYDYRSHQLHALLRSPIFARFEGRLWGSVEWHDFVNYPARDGLGGLLGETRADREVRLGAELLSPPLFHGDSGELRFSFGVVHRQSDSNSIDLGLDDSEFLVNYSYTQIQSGLNYRR